ncbi:MAG: VanW family protein [Clostridia bacterium]|nr:VanW family protein [Clostridia bacterium]
MERTPSNQEHPRTARVVKARNPAEQRDYPNPGKQPIRRVQPRREEVYYEPPYREDNWGRDWEAEQPYSPSDRELIYPKKKGHPVLCGVVIFVCCVLLASLVILLSPQLMDVYWRDMPNIGFVSGNLMIYDDETAADYQQMRQYMAEDVIFPGVWVDGIHVGGMTLDEARQALSQQSEQAAGSFSVTVNIGNMSWTIDSSRVPLERNVERVLAQAYAQGRQNTLADTLATKQTPLKARYNAAMALRSHPVSLYTEMTYDQAKVRELTDSIVAYINRDAQDAAVASFNFANRTFTFTDESYGVYVDGDELYKQVIAKLDAKAYGSVLTFEPTVVTPKHTKVELMNNYKLISSFTTETTSNKNRNTNIDLSAKAINGMTVMPGETFSFNEATGQRTAEKGYKPAAAIAGGQSVDEIGGGVCQTSGTLFNAVARADLEIVYRSPHAWPSTYVEKGMDATVNWPNLDFKFKNNKDTPIFIVSYYADRKVTCEIYGLSLGSGVSVDLESKVTRTIDPPSGINYVLNTSLTPGTSKETVKARTGYVVETYKIWYQNGQEVSRELLCTSNYKAYQRTIEYN